MNKFTLKPGPVISAFRIHSADRTADMGGRLFSYETPMICEINVKPDFFPYGGMVKGDYCVLDFDGKPTHVNRKSFEDRFEEFVESNEAPLDRDALLENAKKINTGIKTTEEFIHELLDQLIPQRPKESKEDV